MPSIQRKQVSWKRLFLRHHLWIPMIPLLIGAVFSAIGWVVIAQANRLDRDGLDAVAIVTARDIRTERDRDGNNRTRYLLSYEFSPGSGERVVARASVARETYNQAQVGQTMAVRYLPEDPGTNRLAAEGSGRGTALIFGLIGLVTLGAGLVVAWFMLRHKASLLRAARRGEVREARVTQHSPTNTQVNGRTMYRFHWVDAMGTPGQSAMTDYADLPALDSVVRVYVDPRSGRGWWEGDF